MNFQLKVSRFQRVEHKLHRASSHSLLAQFRANALMLHSQRTFRIPPAAACDQSEEAGSNVEIWLMDEKRTMINI